MSRGKGCLALSIPVVLLVFQRYGRADVSTPSHLMGFFYRTIRMVDHGIKPCYIFDGKPPELKGGVVRFLFRSTIALWCCLSGG